MINQSNQSKESKESKGAKDSVAPKQPKKLSVIWDAGHGSTINGIYQTSGKRSPLWDKGVLYEGVANRWIVNECIKQMDYARLPYYHISPELEDVSLTTRVNRANAIYEVNPNSYGISVHFNAAGGSGWEIFTSVGVTKSDYIAAEFIDAFKELVPLKPRLGGRGYLNEDKEANFTMVKSTHAPFILIECGFMDNKHDYDLIWTPEFQATLTKAIMLGVTKVNAKYGK